jgi:hypothetical protein
MTEILTGKQLRELAEDALDQRKPDKEVLRNWIRRGADRIDKLTRELDRLESAADNAGSEAAMMMLEDARIAADKTLNRVHQMEAEAEGALDEARAEAQQEADDIIAKAHAEAAAIVASGRETAQAHLAKTESACQARLDKAVARAEKVDRGCRQLVDQAKDLERSYRKRVADIRTEAKAMVSLMERFDSLPVTAEDDEIVDENTVDDLLADIVELNAEGREELEHELEEELGLLDEDDDEAERLLQPEDEVDEDDDEDDGEDDAAAEAG